MVFVFKTTVDSHSKASLLRPCLDALPASRWNFDLMDSDNILRVEGPENISRLVIHILQKQGFECVELD